MIADQLINDTVDFVRDQLADSEGGHDWWHTRRVWINAKRIAKDEGDADMLVVELAALLHDIADSKFHGGDESVGPKVATAFLESKDVDTTIVNRIISIIKGVSYKGGHNTFDDGSKELKIVQDADRLDALGAIGIARTFNYGGFKNRALYDPEIPPNLNMSREEYKKSTAPTINHFYEKLLLLYDGFHTESARVIARGRHEFLITYLDRFFAEWNGTDA